MRLNRAYGFTLIELIIVIGILAVLSIAVVLVLNPAEILRKGRDSQRISDLAAIKSAMGLYAATATTVTMENNATYSCDDGSNDGIWVSLPNNVTIGSPPSGYTFVSVSAVSHGLVTGAGWIPTDITGTTGGASISTWPIDPTNVNNSAYAAAADGNSVNEYYYQFVCNEANDTFKIYANMESNFYGDASPDEAIEEKDGGRCAELYEVGTDLGLGPSGVCSI